MVVGVVSPRIVLPQALVDDAGAPALACIARHEIAHVRRRDAWLAAAIEALLVVAWPVAPLSIAAARVRQLVELACDEAALANADAAERRRYGHLLLDVAEQRPFAFAGAPSLHFGSTLRARVEAIAHQRHWPRAAQGALVSAAVVALLACSSAASAPVPQGGSGARTASAGGGLDEYGYEFDKDPVAAASQAAAKAAPASGDSNVGRLAPEVIQGVVRGSFGAYRACYEAGLKRDAALRGNVTVRFAIEPDGHVQGAADDGSTLPDAEVVRCVVQGFGSLTFPPPQGGYVTVVYPVAFSPGD